MRRLAVVVSALLVAAACSGESKPASTTPVSTMPTAAASVEVTAASLVQLLLDDGATLTVEPGTVNRATTMSLTRLGGAPPGSQLPDGAQAISSWYDFDAGGYGEFDKPVAVEIPYDEALLPSGVAETDIGVLHGFGAAWEVLPAVVDPTRNTLTVRPTHNGLLVALPLVVLGIWALLVVAAPYVAFQLPDTEQERLVISPVSGVHGLREVKATDLWPHGTATLYYLHESHNAAALTWEAEADAAGHLETSFEIRPDMPSGTFYLGIVDEETGRATGVAFTSQQPPLTTTPHDGGEPVEPVPPDQAAPYISQIEQRVSGGVIPNGCGPTGGIDVPDGPLLSWLATFGAADHFRAACDTHDVCYGLNQGKEDCDREFLDDLLTACDNLTSDPSCRFIAGVYHDVVARFGHKAYLEPPEWEAQGGTLEGMDGLDPEGRLLAVERVGRFDEVIVMVLIENQGGTGEFKVRLLTADGSTVDVEPDLSWKDLLPGQRHVLYLSSEFDPFWDVFNLGPELTVALVEEGGAVHDRVILTTPRPSGEILSVIPRRIPNLLTDDEFEACVTYANNGETVGEYRVALVASDGTVINKEPDTFWRNLNPGESHDVCLSTEFSIFDSISDLGSTFAIVLSEQHLGEMHRVEGATP